MNKDIFLHFPQIIEQSIENLSYGMEKHDLILFQLPKTANQVWFLLKVYYRLKIKHFTLISSSTLLYSLQTNYENFLTHHLYILQFKTFLSTLPFYIKVTSQLILFETFVNLIIQSFFLSSSVFGSLFQLPLASVLGFDYQLTFYLTLNCLSQACFSSSSNFFKIFSSLSCCFRFSSYSISSSILSCLRYCSSSNLSFSLLKQQKTMKPMTVIQRQLWNLSKSCQNYFHSSTSIFGGGVYGTGKVIQWQRFWLAKQSAKMLTMIILGVQMLTFGFYSSSGRSTNQASVDINIIIAYQPPETINLYFLNGLQPFYSQNDNYSSLYLNTFDFISFYTSMKQELNQSFLDTRQPVTQNFAS